MSSLRLSMVTLGLYTVNRTAVFETGPAEKTG